MQMTSITNRINERSTPKDVLTNNEHRSNAVAFNVNEKMLVIDLSISKHDQNYDQADNENDNNVNNCDIYGNPQNQIERPFAKSSEEDVELSAKNFLRKFDELKHHCVAGGNMKVFLKIENTDNRTSRLIVIDAFDSEFISLCSGEFGASYKNCKSRERKNKVSYSSIVAYNILTIEGSPQTNKHPSLVDYPEDTNHFILSYEIGDIFVEKEPGGLIRFFQVCEEMSIGNPDGRVIEPKNLNGFFLPKQNSPNKSKEKNFKVTDCGILFDCK
ncbi:hypothetical protein Avbf_18625 [Armadillidium vulgare]|nr:hypothetical protein Avbf_18625 [Armadillidium vulgare]